jgi:RNA polymerase sigma factor (sigma-70 family)
MANLLQFPSRTAAPADGAAAARAQAQREQYIRDHLGVVYSIARAFAAGLPAWVELEDVEQQGMLGLIVAAKSYNRALGVPFEAWARVKIRGYVLSYLREERGYRETACLEDAPEPAAWPLEEVEERDAHDQLAGRVWWAVESLEPRQRRILELLYIEGRTMVEIAEAWGCSKSQIGLLRRRALATLRRWAARQRLAA